MRLISVLSRGTATLLRRRLDAADLCKSGARDWSRTSTSLRTLDSESSASTNSATRAARRRVRCDLDRVKLKMNEVMFGQAGLWGTWRGTLEANRRQVECRCAFGAERRPFWRAQRWAFGRRPAAKYVRSPQRKTQARQGASRSRRNRDRDQSTGRGGAMARSRGCRGCTVAGGMPR